MVGTVVNIVTGKEKDVLRTKTKNGVTAECKTVSGVIFY
jgi:hypothetical protein